jgi:hypothetical protein
MLEFYTAPQNAPFAVALGLLFAIGLLEGIGTLLGFGFSSLLDNVLPDFDLDIDASLDAGDVGHPVSPGNLLSWLRVGQVPVIVLLVTFLGAFGIAGYTLQFVTFSLTGALIPGLFAAVLAFFAALPLTKFFGAGLAKIIPKDESSAPSENSFIGRVATVTLGVARSNAPAQAKLLDEHGKTHYVMVEPDNEGEEFEAGVPVLLVKRQGATFRVIENSAELLN